MLKFDRKRIGLISTWAVFAAGMLASAFVATQVWYLYVPISIGAFVKVFTFEDDWTRPIKVGKSLNG